MARGKDKWFPSQGISHHFFDVVVALLLVSRAFMRCKVGADERKRRRVDLEPHDRAPFVPDHTEETRRLGGVFDFADIFFQSDASKNNEPHFQQVSGVDGGPFPPEVGREAREPVVPRPAGVLGDVAPGWSVEADWGLLRVNFDSIGALLSTERKNVVLGCPGRAEGGQVVEHLCVPHIPCHNAHPKRATEDGVIFHIFGQRVI